MNYEYKQVIVVRKDLKMRQGKTAAQVAHASLAAVLKNLEHPDVKAWLDSNFAKIVVYVNSEKELLDLYEKVKADDVIHSLIEDSGFTEFHGVKTFTCLAIGPHSVYKVDQYTSELPLL